MSTQATFLRDLADHLDRHLVADVRVLWYSIAPSPVSLQVSSRDTTFDAVAAWARSLDVTEVRVREILGSHRLQLQVLGRVGTHDVDVWGVVEPRPDLLDRPSITVAELEAVQTP